MTPKEIYLKLRELRNEHLRLDRIAIEVLCHPDATADDVMRLQGMMVRTRAEYRAVWKKAADKHSNKDFRYDYASLRM